MARTVKFNYIAHLIEAVVLTLMAIGTVFVFSAGANITAKYDLQHFYNFTTLRNIIFFPVAVIVMYAVSMMDYRRLGFRRDGIAKSLSPYLLVISIALLVFVLLFGQGIGPEKRFARRWLHISIGSASVSFQPSELAKWSLLFFVAAFLDMYNRTMKLFKKRFLPLCLIAGLVVILIITQDFGTAAFIALLVFIMLIMGQAKWYHVWTLHVQPVW